MSEAVQRGPSPQPRYGTHSNGDGAHGEIAVCVTAADFNGQSWDGRPFSAVPRWLADAIKYDFVVPHKFGSTDYAQWHVRTKTGVINATPGDWIIRREHGDLSVVQEQDAFILINLRAPDSSQSENG